MTNLKQAILEGIPSELPAKKDINPSVSHAPKRKDILTKIEKKLAIRNALRYFPEHMHSVLAQEFAKELKIYGRVYMYRFMPDYKIKARHLEDFPHNSKQAAAIQMMLSNNLDHAIAQHPEELITYVKDRPGHDKRYAIDANKLKNELGWEPSLQFEEGLVKTIAWYLKNEKWMDNITSGDYQNYYKQQYS